MKKHNVLVFPCGSEIGLEVYRAINKNKDFVLYGGSSVNDHGRFVYQNYIENIPFVDDDEFINKINQIILEHKIDLIVPAHDSVVLKLSENSNKISAKIVTSSEFACNVCRSKKKTYDLFNDILPIPKIYNKEEVKLCDLPLFLKPSVGQGSKGTKKIETIEELNNYYISDDLLILEYLPGDEYTIDCFTDYKGNLLYCEGRIRDRILNGISVNCKRFNDPNFIKYANLINEKIDMSGAWFFQLKRRKNGEFVLLEIATRIAGTMEFQRGYGVNLALLSLYNALEIDTKIIKNNYEIEFDRALSGKFKFNFNYNTVYIDLDDTIIINDKVNPEAISYIYKAKNSNKKIILLSRHKYDITDTLKKYCIGQIFDKIINVEKDRPKSSYITDKESIFIDDSFKEREDVSKNCNIPVFDIDMFEFL
ncbi:MAG: ATP-grasp domain-containing protein [Firmicutes bacterium]|nr:ATP-grasp domain-containing protein [Bacillota bacterium]